MAWHSKPEDSQNGGEVVGSTEVARASFISQRLKAVAAELMRLAEEVEQLARTPEPPRHEPARAPLGTSTPMSKYLTVGDAARFVGLAEQTLNGWRVSGYGPAYHKLGRRVVYDVEELERWIQRQRLRHTAEQAPRGNPAK
jgi:hypothetical protein